MMRKAVRVAAAGSLVALGTGLGIMLGGTLLTGDWYAFACQGATSACG
jgi:hypothetical protein